MRFDHLQGEGSGHGRVERVTAPLENAHADGGCMIQCVEVTTPNVPTISGRVVKGWD